MLRPIVFCSVMVCATATFAMVKPIPSKSDPHFQHIKYTTEIIQIQARVGTVMEIELSPGETDIQFMMGDRDAWTIKTAGNLFSLKPKATFADTNLKIWSSKSHRQYWFKIAMTKSNKTPELWQLKFEYPPEPPAPPPAIPPEVLAMQIAAQQKQAVESHLSPSLDKPTKPDAATETSERPINGTYGIIGPEELTPTSVYDNGEITAIAFSPNNPMPTIFAQEADGSESRVNYHIENDMMIVHRVARKFVLRRGSAVACLINGDFNPSGSNSKTNTVSDFVKREIKGAN